MVGPEGRAKKKAMQMEMARKDPAVEKGRNLDLVRVRLVAE
jgi:hypothetical protein